jgi:hypothetical protein
LLDHGEKLTRESVVSESPSISRFEFLRAIKFPGNGSGADIARAFAAKAGYSEPTQPETIAYLNRVLDSVLPTLMAKPGNPWEDSEAASFIMDRARYPGLEIEAYRRITEDLGLEEDLETAIHEFVAGYVMGLIARTGWFETWPPVDPNEPFDWRPDRP